MPAGLQIRVALRVARVAICDDHPIVRSGFSALLATRSDVDVVAEVSNGRDALALARANRCDVLLLDIAMPDQSGVDTLRAISQGSHATAPRLLSSDRELQVSFHLRAATWSRASPSC